MEKQLYQYLKTKTSITNLVSSRFWPHWLPQSNSTFPVLTLTLIGNEYLYHLDGNAGQATATFQIDAWGRLLSDVVAVAAAVRTELNAFSGTMDGKTVHFCYLDEELDLSEPPVDGSENWLFRKVQRWKIKHVP